MTEDFCCSLTTEEGPGVQEPGCRKRPGSRSYHEAIVRNHLLTSGLPASGTVRA